MINRFFLGIALLPAALYSRMGVNIKHLKAILKAKLVMDDRRPSSLQQTKQKTKNKSIKMATLFTMLMMALLGLFFNIPFFIVADPITQFTLYFSFFITILAFTIISDFTSVLIDIRDNYIILPKPVNDTTVLLSRLLHIVIHTSKLVISLNIAGIITVFLLKGFYGAAILIFLIPFATLFTIFLINALYILVLKITTPEKFKALINYFQIAFAILIFGVYQLVPRLIEKASLQAYAIPEKSWGILAPPYWFAAAWKVFYGGGSLYLIAVTILSILMPILSVWLVVKYLAPTFNQKLTLITGSDQGEQTIKTEHKGLAFKRKGLAEKLAALFTQKGSERMGFLFTWKMIGRSRDYKMKTFPSIGYLMVYFFVILFRNKDLLSTDKLRDSSNLGTKILLLTIIYMLGFTILQAMSNLKQSDKYKAAWIYFITPIQEPGNIISGAVKATIAIFFLPLAIALIILSVAFIGWNIIPNLLLGISNQLLICFFVAYISMREFPFARTATNKGTGFIRGLFSLIFPVTLGILHYFIYNFIPVVLLLALLSLIGTWLIAGSIKRRDWNSVQSEYRE
ncbi:MAG: hypothetical protein EAZ35_07040 [Sphingobacteriia bacterium]|nr:MAG: hypothetical protein EAZ35_07040 [Sphingobacteriia bacterium]